MLKNLIPLSILLVPWLGSGCRSTDASGVKASEDSSLSQTSELGTGRYVGTLTPEGGATRVATVMDLVQTHDDQDPTTYRAVFRVLTGGYGSHEYAGAYFHDVTFAKKTKQLVFAGGPDGITVTDAKFAGGSLRGRFSSAKDQTSAVLERRPGNDDTPKTPQGAAHHVTGNYVGSCPDSVVSLQVEASKWRGMRMTDGGLFGGYRFSGRTGQTDDAICGAKQTCVKESYASGSFNILTGGLTFKTTAGEKSCKVTGDSVACGGCSMVKDPISPHAVLDVQRDFKIHERKEHLSEAEPKAPRKLTGQYYGYVHHKRSDAYQLIALNVKAEDQQDAAGLPTGKQHVGGVATLYFGEGDSNEFIAYRFKEEMWPAAAGRFVFDGDGEAMLIVNRWTDKAVYGTWFSKTYGDVGTVELQRDLVPGLASDSETMEKLSGTYKGDDWDFELSVSANISEEPADFFPLKVYGWAREKIDHSRRRTIEEGTYDFYTGAFAFRLDDSRIIAGRVTPAGMQLFWPPKPRLGTPLVTGVTQLFRRVGENQTAWQAKAVKP
jgi:hypothetical protein